MKLNKEIIGAIAGEVTKIGQSHLAIAEYLKELGVDAPAIDEVLPKADKKSGKADKKAPAKKEEEVTEEEEVSLSEMSLKDLKALATEEGIEFPKSVKKNALIELIEAAVSEEDAEEEEETNEEEMDEVALEEMSVDELKSFIEENLVDVDVPKKKKAQKAAAYKQALIELIEENLETDEVEAEEEEEEASATTITYEDENEEDVTVDLSELTAKELKALAEDFELEFKKKATKDDLIAIILEAFEEEDEDGEEESEDDAEGEEEDEQDIAEQLELDDMDVEELAEILEEAGLSTKGKKQALIARIVEAVENGDIEIDEEEGE